MSEQISAYTIFYNDFDFLDDAVSLIGDWVDEIVVVDGPYGYAIETLKFMGEYYDEDHLPEQMVALRNNPKVKYCYRVWQDEAEKRAFGYEACSNEIILAFDADELIDLDADRMAEFIASGSAAATLDCLALVRSDVVMGPPHRTTHLFKRSMISPVVHIDYLATVGIDIGAPDMGVMYGASVGSYYHPSLMRSVRGHVVKGAFYVSMYHGAHGTRDRFLESTGCENFDELRALVPTEVLHEVFVRQTLDAMNAPDSYVLSRRTVVNALLDPIVAGHDSLMSSRSFCADRPTPLLLGIRSISYLPDLESDREYEVALSLTNARVVGLGIHEIHYGTVNSDNVVDVQVPEGQESGRVGFHFRTTSSAQGTFARLLSVTAVAETGLLGSLDSVSVQPLS